jgi:hypothetical protein
MGEGSSEQHQQQQQEEQQQPAACAAEVEAECCDDDLDEAVDEDADDISSSDDEYNHKNFGIFQALPVDGEPDWSLGAHAQHVAWTNSSCCAIKCTRVFWHAAVTAIWRMLATCAPSSIHAPAPRS